MEDAFRKTVVNISHALSSYDLEQIVYLFAIPEQDGKITRLSVLTRLEREGKFSATKPEGLDKLLQDIHRSDLSGRISDYCSRFRRSRSCCCGSSQCERVAKLTELCVQEADNTRKRLSDLQQKLEKFSENQRKTPSTDKFYREMGDHFRVVQSDFDKFLISPLQDLQKLVGLSDNIAGSVGKEGDEPTTAGENPSTKSTITVKPTSSQWEAGQTEDYDILEPIGSQDNFGGKSLATRIPIPTRATKVSSGHSSPVQLRHRTPWGSPQRGRSRDYESGGSPQRGRSRDSSSLTSSTDDSGFAELRLLHGRYSAGSRFRNDSLPHAWRESRESREYTSLDLATCTNQSSDYMNIHSRTPKK